MDTTPTRSGDPNIRLREQISNLSSLFVLSAIMFDGRTEEEIMPLALTAGSQLSRCRAVGGYLVRDGQLVRFPFGHDSPGAHVRDQLKALDGNDGPVDLPGQAWAWAYPLRSTRGCRGYLVVGAPAELSVDEAFLLKVLAQQAGAALLNASHREADRSHAVERDALNEQLTATVADLERQTKIHTALTEVSASGQGEEGIARSVHELTGLPVAVEDRFGNLRAWAGPGRPDPYPKANERKRSQLLRQARRDGRPVRDGDRLLAPAQPRDEVLGVLTLIDPDGIAGTHEIFALEHGATVLAMELAHLRSLAEMEVRMRRELVDDLLNGTDDESAFGRAAALGYDLHEPHRVVVVQWRGRATDDALSRAVERAAAGLELGSLLAKRLGVVVLVARCPAQWGGWGDFYDALSQELGSTTGAIGVGGWCETPADVPRSFQEASRALAIRQGSLAPGGVTAFENLGFYRILATGESNEEIERFVREWIGPLLDYDSSHRPALVTTLCQYLDCGGNYDETAEALGIHRSTLAYRLQRIREVTGFDLNEVDTRLNLHIATRVWKVLAGSS